MEEAGNRRFLNDDIPCLVPFMGKAWKGWDG